MEKTIEVKIKGKNIIWRDASGNIFQTKIPYQGRMNQSQAKEFIEDDENENVDILSVESVILIAELPEEVVLSYVNK